MCSFLANPRTVVESADKKEAATQVKIIKIRFIISAFKKSAVSRLSRVAAHLQPISLKAHRDLDLLSLSTMAQALVDEKISGKKVMVFSKPHCPFCVKAKKVFQQYIKDSVLAEEDYEVLEIDSLPNCSDIQDYLLKKTGGRSVPRVFVNQKFIGGGDDVVSKDKDGSLKTLLS